MVKFLIIRFSSIGDIVLTTPVIRCLKEQLENAEVHFLTKPAFKSILEENPHLTKIHTLESAPADTIAKLREENFDYVIDLQNNVRSMNIKRALKRMYFTVHKLNIKKWLLVNFKINKLPSVHIVERYMNTIRLFDINDDGKGLEYYIPEEEHVKPTDLPDGFGPGFIAMVTGAKHNTKKLPEEKQLEILQKLDHPVILIGGPEDKSKAELLVQKMQGKKILNGCGKYTLNQSASLIQQALCVITHDTGMMHVASAFGKKIITVWGNTVPDFGMYAYRPDNRSQNFEVQGLKCRPCSKLGKEKCPKKHFKCMVDQDTGKIASEANRLAGE